MLVDIDSSPRAKLDKECQFAEIVGHHPRIVNILKLIAQVADSGTTILIYGESGTGKELVARALHTNSSRRNKPFVPLNCGALPENLLESELFGHVRGAFTGAVTDRQGWFEYADGGTILLDEIHDMSPALQLKLLRVSQTGEFSPVGSAEFRKSDVRIVAATYRDLKELVEDRKFRDELYYRLNVIDLCLPPLRERKSDLPLLIKHFLNEFGAQYRKERLRLCHKVEELLNQYTYPGNIRELRNIMERCVVLTEGEVIETPSLPANLLIKDNTHSNNNLLSPFQKAKQLTVEQFEQEYITECLRIARGNISKAARSAGMHVANLHAKIKKYDIDPHLFKNTKP
ncbi:MAG: sigma-54 interaction domain-containing protein [Planctomycetota bacterium]|jgi:transcriptional regulator with GAF, ATPase, and Fis domain